MELVNGLIVVGPSSPSRVIELGASGKLKDIDPVAHVTFVDRISCFARRLSSASSSLDKTDIFRLCTPPSLDRPLYVLKAGRLCKHMS